MPSWKTEPAEQEGGGASVGGRGSEKPWGTIKSKTIEERGEGENKQEMKKKEMNKKKKKRGGRKSGILEEEKR